MCFAHILSDELNGHRMPRPHWSTHSHTVLVFNAKLPTVSLRGMTRLCLFDLSRYFRQG